MFVMSGGNFQTQNRSRYNVGLILTIISKILSTVNKYENKSVNLRRNLTKSTLYDWVRKYKYPPSQNYSSNRENPVNVMHKLVI